MADDLMGATIEDAYAEYAVTHARSRRNPFRDRWRANSDATGSLRVDLYEQGLRDTRAMPVAHSLIDPGE